MRASAWCSSLIIALIPVGRALQAQVDLEVCSWDQPPSPFEEYLCPSIYALNPSFETLQLERRHQAGAVSDPKYCVWNTHPDCFGEYCVFTNNGFFGRGLSLVTKALSHRRVAQIQELEPVSRPGDGKAQIVEIPGKGKGLVAIRSIRHGERIMAAKPALLVHRDAFSELELEEIYDLMEVAVDSLPRARKEEYLAQAATMGGQRVADILFTNSFQISVGDHDGFHYGNFPEVSLLNHDCRPNLAFYIDQNLTHHTHAVRDIKAGEELTISYIDPMQVRSERQERVRNSMGFLCSCSHCSLPKNEVDASDTRLLTIARIEDELSNFNSQTSSPTMVEEFITLYKKERLEVKMSGAYTLAALNYNLFGKAGMARRYALLSVEAGLLESGPDAPDVQAMRELADNPEAHWSWSLKPIR
ncbi:SET domain-containing protein [Xylariaceae sp. FL1651]|nr:SET domain-containing protein [Xylariaceae sp. FL1651]